MINRDPILSLCIDAADELSLRRPATLFSVDGVEGDTSDRKLLRALTKTCQFLAADFDWQVLRREQVWTTVAGENQRMLPYDFARFIRGGYLFNTTRRWKLQGPVSAADWQSPRMYGIGTFPGRFRVVDDTVKVFPAPGDGERIVFEYISNGIGTLGEPYVQQWVRTDESVASTLPPDEATPELQSSDAAPAPTTRIKRFVHDGNRTLWGDALVTHGIVYHYLQSEGLSYAAQEQRFMKLVQDSLAEDGGRRPINMASDGPRDAFDDLMNGSAEAALGSINLGPNGGYSVP